MTRIGMLGRGWTRVFGFALVVALGATLPTRAAVLTGTGRGQSAPEPTGLQRYLQGGPVVWSSMPAPEIPTGLKLTDSKGNLKDNSLVDYLYWKRGQAPEFFDKRHPMMATLFKPFDSFRPLILAQIVSQYETKRMAQAQALVSSKSVPSKSASYQVLEPVVSGKSTSGAPSSVDARAQTLDVSAQPVPEPSAIVALVTIFGATAVWSRRRRPPV